MRILITTDTVGGVWTFTKQLSTELLARGHKVALVSFGRAPSLSQTEWAGEASASHGGAFSYTASEVPLEWMQENDGAYRDGALALIPVAKDFAPDVLLSSQFCFGRLPLPIPRVIVAHSDVLSWAAACRATPLPPSKWLAQYVRLVGEGLEAADAVATPTHWMLSALGAHFTLPQHAVVIHNGRSFTDDPIPSESKKLQAVTAGRFWDEGKNLKLLNGFMSPIPIVIAGSFELESTGATIDSGCITLIGELSETDMRSLFCESAIYICTSLYEPFGLAPLEAALCGCAVLANDIPSLREVWGDECALFFRNKHDLTVLLNELADRGKLACAQERSQRRARMFTGSRMAEKYLNLFERLLHSHAHRSSAHAA